MAKLFALEDDSKKVDTEANDLLIDKVLKLAEKNKEPVSITADVIKQRQELKKDIQQRLNAEPENQDEDSENNDDNANPDDNPDNGGGDGEEKDKNGEGGNSDDSSKDNSSGDNKDKENLSAQADDKDSLNSVIGSGLSGNEGGDDSKKDEPAQESFKQRPVQPSKVFAPLKNSYSKYLVSLESFNVKQRLAIEEQPIVYVKDAVLQSLNNLVSIANTYIGKNKTFIESNVESIKNINGRLTVLRQFIENKKFHFTNALVSDQNLLSQVSVLDKSDLRDTVKILVTYIENSNKFVNYVLGNDFNTLGSALGNSNFIKEEDDFAYKAMLPGFNMVRAHLDQYENYLKANIENFHYYQLKTFKTEHLYNLNAIALSDDKELDFVMENLDKLMIDLSMSVDNFNVVNNNLNKLIDELKVFIYDVEKDKYANLAELDIDSKVKDFIKFKMVSEAYYCNVSMLMNYILNVDTIINKCIDLKMSAENRVVYQKRNEKDSLEFILKSIEALVAF